VTIESYTQPPPLKPGDTIGVCAPSGVFDHKLFIRGITALESMGFNIHIPYEIYAKKRYMAGDERVRARVINALFQNREVDGIICARGGFGALRTLDYIDYDLIKENPKIFVGFSDITALLVAISERSLIQVLHGPVVTTLANAHLKTLEALYKELTSPYTFYDISINDLPSIMHYGSDIVLSHGAEKILRGGRASGRLTGGNLATLCHLIGTRFQPDLNGTILFLEDVGEPPYKIDRMLTHMRLAGVLDGVKGVILGSFEGCNIKKCNEKHRAESVGETLDSYKRMDALRLYEAQEMIEEIVLEIFDDPQQPVVSGLDAGHGKINISLRFSAMVEINVDEKRII